MLRFCMLATLITCAPQVAIGGNPGAIQVDVFPPSIYTANTAQLDGVLGVDGAFEVEGFEENSLTAYGLEILVAGSNSFLVFSGSEVDGEVWDGSSCMQNQNPGGPDGRDVRFEIARGAYFFGVGISHLQQATRLVVNGVDLGDIRGMPGFQVGGPNVRNGYLLLTAPLGSPIYSVEFDGTDQSDAVNFDHIVLRTICPGDVNGDDLVDFEDLNRILVSYGQSCNR